MEYDERCKVYTNALIRFGDNLQMTVALEELSECQKEICKVMRGKGNLEHLAEEVADAAIMLEQIQYFFGIGEMVVEQMDRKIKRLEDRLHAETMGE